MTRPLVVVAYAPFMKRLLILILFALLPCPALAEDYAARVVGIADGDTLTVLTADGTRVKIRLYGIDAPETAQEFGAKAKQAASEMAYGEIVTIRVMDKDRYGRTVAVVVLPDGSSLNQELVQQGMAWWYRQYAPNDPELEQREDEARTADRGLWGRPNPTPRRKDAARVQCVSNGSGEIRNNNVDADLENLGPEGSWSRSVVRNSYSNRGRSLRFPGSAWRP